MYVQDVAGAIWEKQGMHAMEPRKEGKQSMNVKGIVMRSSVRGVFVACVRISGNVDVVWRQKQ